MREKSKFIDCETGKEETCVVVKMSEIKEFAKNNYVGYKEWLNDITENHKYGMEFIFDDGEDE